MTGTAAGADGCRPRRSCKEEHMARVSKGRREAYDNIAPGSAITSRERTILGALPPTSTAVGNSENIAVGSAYGEERVVAGSALMEGEQLG